MSLVLKINSWEEAIPVFRLDVVMSAFNLMNCSSFLATMRNTKSKRADPESRKIMGT